ncbi:MAG: hypothetical protein WCT04_20585 [Planctomycetota bacterium]
MLGTLKQPRRLLFGVLLSAFVLFGTTGCVCPNVAWLPDSSGIVYADKVGTQIVRYDLARKARKVIVQDTNTDVHQVAVSPEGTRCGFAKLERTSLKDSDTSNLSYQVTTCDLDGREHKQSSIHVKTTRLETKATETTNSKPRSMISWSLSPTKILITADEEKYSMIYDCETDKWTEFGAAQVDGFANGGVRPDGKGLLTGGRGPAFITLDGWIRECPDVPELKNKLPLSTEWDKNIARVVFADGVFDFDTENMTHTFKENAIQVLSGEGNVTWFYRFPKTDLQLCAFKKEEEGKKTMWRLEAQVQTLRKRKMLLKEGECYLTLMQYASYPSPDGTKIAICLAHHNRILIIDNTGEIVDTITTQMVEPK